MGVVSFDADIETVTDVMIRRGARVLNTGTWAIERPDLMSRLLAKIALEFLTARCIQREGWDEFIIDNLEFDLIRNHARRGAPREWPYSHRTLYDERFCFDEDTAVQRVWEWTTFVARQDGVLHEVYSVLCLFGEEYAINYAGPDIEGYKLWLLSNGAASPLYPDGLPAGRVHRDDNAS